LLSIRGRGAGGEICCLYMDVTALERHYAKRAKIGHFSLMAHSLDTLREQLKSVLAQENVAQAVEGYARTLVQRLEAVAPPRGPSGETVRIDRLLSRIVAHANLKHARHTEIEIVAGAGLWPVRLDIAGFEAVMGELIGNALKVMPDGGKISLETMNARIGDNVIALHGDPIARDYVRLSVQDTGPGMSKGIRAQLSPGGVFHPAPAHRLGLGLGLVHGFAARLGGHVEIHAVDGRGTRVDLYLPRAGAASSAKPGEEPRGTPVPGVDAL